MKALSNHILAADFDPTGVNLIEASAGTGKTFSIQTLYLRLVVERGIPVEKILVVTFTEAATAELRDRLRKILEASYTRGSCPPPSEMRSGRSPTLHSREYGSYSKLEGRPPCRPPGSAGTATDGAAVDANTEPDRITEILALTPQHIPEGMTAEAVKTRRLRRALLDFDQAAVFTIHGFCQRTLNEFAFECGQDFDADVISGDALLTEICTDHWRAINYKQPESAAEALIQSKFPDPGELASLAKTYIGRHGIKLKPDRDPADNVSRHVDQTIEAALAALKKNKHDLITTLRYPDTSIYYTSDAARYRTIKAIEECCALPPVAKTGQLRKLFRVYHDLTPAAVKNPSTIPTPIQICIDYANDCLDGAARHGFTPTRGSGPWAPPAGFEIEWNDILQRTRSAIRQEQGHLQTFSEAVIQAHPTHFNKTEFSDPSTVTKRADALLNDLDANTCRLALEKFAGIKLKARVKLQDTEPIKTTLSVFKKAFASVTDQDVHSCVAAHLHEIATDYARRKREMRGMTFDDMIIRLHQVVDGNPGIATIIRSAYDAALIDEFQDTDPAQYSIFATLFAQANLPVFFVGDPKQAIYSFRGGDIYTYCEAKASVHADRRYELDKNFRSQQWLITAVNTIFKDRGASLFVHEDITYDGKLNCNGLDEHFQDAGRIDATPFKIWTVERSDGKDQGKHPSSYTSADAHRIYQWVAAEVVRLLNDPQTGFVDAAGNLRRIKASDIAILVRRHAEAHHLFKALTKRDVPVIRQAADNSFATPEARSLFYVIRAMHDPGSSRYVRTALASHLLPVSDHELRILSEQTPVAMTGNDEKKGPPNTLDGWIEIFQEAHTRWDRNGLYAGLAHLLRESGMKSHLVASPQGERKLSHVLQLGDILHRISAERAFGPAALLAWYTRQLSADSREPDDAFETRLESDADAVQIMTLFKSKGLEFPVVFVPTMWSSLVGVTMRKALIFHDRPADGASPAVYMHLDTADQAAKCQADAEKAQEDIRNFYVAATRASFRTYVVTGSICGQDSTLAKCLPPDLLDTWNADPQSAISVEAKSAPASQVPCQPSGTHPDPERLTVKGEATVDKTRGHASFSAIAPTGDGGTSARDYDAYDESGEYNPDNAHDKLDIFSFPSGIRTGNCWHKIFEAIDFTDDAATHNTVINEQLKLARLDNGSADEASAKQAITQAMVKTVLEAPLKADDPSLQLKAVPRVDRITEMSFNFALQGSGANDGNHHQHNAIWHVLHDAWGDAPKDSPHALFLARLKSWERTIPNGFMTGFIDLVFRTDDTYFILDWKSNRLGGNPDNFEQTGLIEEMATHAYFLQYLIYTVALDRYLRQSLDHYDYDKHFGGVLYLFLRGMESDSQRGVYGDKPEKELITKLARALSTHGGK